MLLPLLLIVVVIMQQAFVTTNIQKINGKTFLVPEYNLQGYEQFFLPKLEFKGMQHVYFNPDEINQVYKQQNIDPDNLDCNLKYDADKDTQPFVPPARLPRQDSVQKEQEAVKVEQKKEEVVEEEVRGKPKPKPREKGYTHFIQIPLIDACRESFDNVIKSVIDANDQDSLVSRNSLHVTVMVLRLRSEEDLPKWKRILESIKLRKVKLTLRGVGIFPVKPNTNYTKILYIKLGGLDDLIHDVVQKAISGGLLSEKELSHIHFDKQTDMYKTAQTHVTILKTKDEDIIDATEYMRQLNKLTILRPHFSDIRMSMLGSFDGERYYDQLVIPVDK